MMLEERNGFNMKKNIAGNILKKVTGVLMAFAVSISGIPMTDVADFIKEEKAWADEEVKKSDFTVNIETDSTGSDFTTHRTGEMIFVDMYITGGVGEKQYKYEIKNLETGEIEKSTDYKDCYTDWGMFGFVLTSVGQRELVVYVKDEEGSVVKSDIQTIEITEFGLNAGILLDEELTVRGYNVGDTIELAIIAGGGNGDYTYKYEMSNSDTGKVTVLKDFCKDDTIEVELPEAGTVVSFQGIVKDSAGNECQTNSVAIKVTGDDKNSELQTDSNEKGVFEIEGATDYLECIVGELNLSSIFVNDESDGYQYKYEIIDVATGKIEKTCEYSIGNAFGIIITSPGTKQVKGYIKDITGLVAVTNTVTIEAKEAPLSATLSIRHNGSTVIDRCVVGDEILLVPVAVGGSGEYTYRYERVNTDTKEKEVLKDYCKEPAYTEILTEEGSKEYVVSVKDSQGNIIETNYVMIYVYGEYQTIDWYSFVKLFLGNTMNTIEFIKYCFNNNIK